ncbi:hypothetical protein K443DRAFT_109173, partial [Laccaria amethystina LaAM-08-1]
LLGRLKRPLKIILLAGPSLMGSTYPSAHQQAPSTMASFYGWGAQYYWGKVTNTCGDWTLKSGLQSSGSSVDWTGLDSSGLAIVPANLAW